MRTQGSPHYLSLGAALGVLVFLPVVVSARTESTHPARDYIFPGEASGRGQYVRRPAGPGEPARATVRAGLACIDCAQTVIYTAFDGAVYQLQAFEGKNVALLLPDSWLGAGGFTVEERRTLLDRSDWFYELFKELMQAEPVGSGLLTIAVVPRTCGGGCGYVGAKGIEIAADQGNFAFIQPELAADKVPGVVIHEMSHNFDLHANYLYYLPDHAHAWTTFMGEYSAVYARSGKRDLSPEALEDFKINAWYRPYYEDPTADWAECVRDGLCEGRAVYRNDAWGGIMLRFAQIHGPAAVRGAMAFLNAYKATEPEPAGAEAREDLHIEALAAGAGLDLGCYVDAWRWQASPALRARMTSAYGSASAFCGDADGDGFSVLAGDCNDGSGSVHPGATETPNGVDDDCDRLVDDVLATEPVAGDFPSPLAINYPAEVRGSITASDSDFFLLTLPGTPATHEVEINLCSAPDFQGWVFVYDQLGGWLDYHYASQGQCAAKTYSLTGGLTWRLGVELNVASQPGGYRMTVAPKRRWPTTWGSVEPMTCASGYRLRSTTESLAGVLAAPQQVRFWVSGVGFVGATPYASPASYSWLPAGIQEATHGYRAQLVSGPIPVEDATAARWFSATDCPVLRVSNQQVTEGNTGTKIATFPVTLSSPSNQTVTVGYSTADGTATTAGGDYLAASGTLTFSPGVTTQPVNVTVNGDTMSEPDETFLVRLAGPTNAPIARGEGEGTITDDDPTLLIDDVAIIEGSVGTKMATFTVTLTPSAPSPVTVSYESAGESATSGTDFTPISGTLTFTPGQVAQPIDVPVAGDVIREPNETFIIDLSGAVGARIGGGGRAFGTILDDDLPLPGSFYTVAPCRAVDTRTSDGPALVAGTTRLFTLVGRCGIPSTAKTVSLNVVATGATHAGHLTLFPGGTAPSPSSNLNFSAGQTRSNNAMSLLGAAGDLSIVSGQSDGSVHVIIDVNGYFE